MGEKLIFSFAIRNDPEKKKFDNRFNMLLNIIARVLDKSCKEVDYVEK